jgi:hypothetical protein
MRARTLLAILPAVAAGIFIPPAHADFTTQTCTASGPANIATVYSVLGRTYRPAGAMEYAFVDVNSTPSGLDVCIRVQSFFGGSWTWEGVTAHFPNTYDASATVIGDNDTASCPDVVVDDNVNGIPYRVATAQSGNATAICITLGTENLRITATVNTPALPTVTEDPNVNYPEVYARNPAFPAGGTESSQCSSQIPEAGSSYVTTSSGYSAFIYRNFSNSVCLRAQKNSSGVGLRTDFQTVGVFTFATFGIDCDQPAIVDTRMGWPLEIRVFTDSMNRYLCVQVNGNFVTLHLDGGVSAIPTVHLDA